MYVYKEIYPDAPGACNTHTMQGHHGYLHLTSILFTIYQQVVACSRASLSQGYFMGPKYEFDLKWPPIFAETDGHFPRRFASHETPGSD